jgi:diaminopimelate decarboxylase
MTKKIKPPYIKPIVARMSFTDTDKLKGMYLKMPSTREAGGYPVDKLLTEYGSPLYVVSEASLRQGYRGMFGVFSKRYEKVVIAYSYKTNYLSGICAVLHQEGAWAEVVSGFEYEMAKRLGIPGEKIIFNGPYKKPAELNRAFSEGAAVNLDSCDEFGIAEQAAETLGREARVGVRVNMQLNHPAWDKFGFSLENGKAYEICRRISRHKYLKLAGLHCHVGTYVIDLGIYRRVIDNLASLAVRIRETLKTEISYLDIGGGFPSVNTLHTQLMPGETISPTPDQYADVICDIMSERAGEFSNPPLLILEPGRSIVDESMVLLSKVIAVKERENKRRFAIIDAGVNLLPSAYYYKHDISSNREPSGATESIDIFGPLCMQIDVIRRDAALPCLQTGDILTIKNVGAYNFSQSMPFIFARPAVIMVSNKGIDVLRRAETYDDLKGLEKVPERLLSVEAIPGSS